MRRILFFALAIVLSTVSKAQAVGGLDETALLGEWVASDYAGVWSTLGYRWPKYIKFNDGTTSYIEVGKSSGGDTEWLAFGGYWVGGTITGKFTLHFLSNRDYNGYSGVSLLNFVVVGFDGKTLKLTTYDGQGEATFVRPSQDAINAPTIIAQKLPAYTVDGKPKKQHSKGVYIQGGTKRIAK